MIYCRSAPTAARRNSSRFLLSMTSLRIFHSPPELLIKFVFTIKAYINVDLSVNFCFWSESMTSQTTYQCDGFPRISADDINISFNSETFLIGKTEFIVIGSRQRLATFNNHELRVTVDDEQVRQVNSTKTLQATLDENLSWENHVEDIPKKIGIGAMKRVCELIEQQTTILKGFHRAVLFLSHQSMGWAWATLSDA